MTRAAMLLLVAHMVKTEADELYYGRHMTIATRLEADELYALAKRIEEDAQAINGASQDQLNDAWVDAMRWWDAVPCSTT